MRVSNVDKHAREGEPPVRLCNYVDVYHNDRIHREMHFMAATARPEEITRFGLKSGDVLITKDSEEWNDIGVPSLVEDVDSDVVSGYHLALLRAHEGQASGRFLHRAFESRAVAHQLHVAATGVIRYGLSHSAIKSVRLAVPPLAEQAAIVRFLDHADRRISRYIAAKEKLIALLDEYKQALVHRAVTGQIDVRTGQPYPAYRHCQGTWSSLTPKHWKTRKLGHLAQVFNGATPSRSREDYWRDGTVPWLNSSKVNDGDVVEPSEWVTERALVESAISLVPSGAVILGLIGQGRTRGMSALLRISATISQNLAAVVPGGEADGAFLRHLFASHYWDIRELGRGGNQEALNCDIVARLRLPIPPIDEQIEIARRIEDALARLEGATETMAKQTELLRDYRTRLVADVVTGKLDVREAAAALPDLESDADGVEFKGGELDGNSPHYIGFAP